MLDIQGHLLLVGNDQELSSLLIKILNRKGCQVTAATMETALEMIAQNDYDGVLVDWFTDHKHNSGFQKVIVSLAKHRPVILFTDVVSDEDGKPARKLIGEHSLPMLSFDVLVRQVLQDVNCKIR